jgi:hypothetical protein
MESFAAKMYLKAEARAWLRHNDGATEVVTIVPKEGFAAAAQCYEIYTAYDERPVYLGRILFDEQGYWIYDGDTLQVDEQEQLGHFILNYVERI